jgi:hypothetical protein
MPRTVTREAMCCSFCGKTQLEVAKLVAGPGVFICNECIDLCNQIIAEALPGQDSSATEKQATTDATEPPEIRTWDGLSDEDLLHEMVQAHAAHHNVDRAVRRDVQALRERGMSWARIGEALGMTRQSAWERFSAEE